MSRRKARAGAMACIYAQTYHEEQDCREILKEYFHLKESEIVFAERLIKAVMSNREKLDEMLRFRHVPPIIVSAILLIGLAELIYLKESSKAVIISEYTEIAKKYGERGYAKFINAVLDNLDESGKSNVGIDNDELKWEFM